MADRRKLQGEIERCHKKVQEGVETFEDLWHKAHNAPNSNQKEKYEADLKKEIKKLQRLRDQIKSWIASSEIKDKRLLLDDRKLIETQMERFKVLERETKTKAYSKEGLGAAQKLDPAQREKDEVTNWMADSIAQLKIQIDQFECENEAILVALKKKKSDKEKTDRVEELKNWLEKHRYHINQLETLMRMLDNDTVDVDQIKKIKDDVEYYIESCQDPDFEENEYIYEDLELDDMQEYLAKTRAALANHTASFDSGTTKTTNSSNATGDEEGANSVHSYTPTSTSSSPAPSPGLTNHSKGVMDLCNPGTTVNASCTSVNNSTSNSITNSTITNNNGVLVTSSSTTTGSSSLSSLSSSLSSSVSSNVKPQPVWSLSTSVSSSIPSVSSSNSSSKVSTSQTTTTGTNLTTTATSTLSTTTTTTTTTTVSTTITTTISTVTTATTNTSTTMVTSSSSSIYSGITTTSNSAASYSMAAAVTAVPTSTSVTLSSLTSGPWSQTIGSSRSQVNSNSSAISQLVNTTNINTNLNITTNNNNTNTNNNINNNSNSNNSNNNNPLIMNGPSVPGGLGVKVSSQLQQQQQPQSQPQQQQSSNSGPGQGLGTTSAPVNQLTSMSSLKSIAQQAIASAGLENSNMNDATTTLSTSNLFETSTSMSGAATNSMNSNASNVTSTTSSVIGLLSGNSKSLIMPSCVSSSVSNLTSSAANSAVSPASSTGMHQSEAHIPPLLGVAPLGPVQLPKQCLYQLHMLEAACRHTIYPVDSQRLRPYLPPNPCPTPSYYPQQALPHSDSVEFFHRLSTETLFFIFYFMEGTKAQYLAAKALKKQSWRFHTKYMMWFQRHEEPKTITDEYEQGTYVYFDYEKWGQRKKEHFTFEYRYLEDRELN
ncbi:CCR4-NOT transcription complex subunit 3-like isoform X2 [Panonychus citri]|uniref:CCR4-NOT transcription complex subunit 3-like isoform X2 n=1 Tax=Panonychus citri TaxID=50023 RepID=UPI00230763AE|nr:CCR4-NOT transcription complex subunit 3-like isoform X2 [Panonychus citri]